MKSMSRSTLPQKNQPTVTQDKNTKSTVSKKNCISKLNIFYTNADSLSNKKDELELLIKQNDIDVALICETEPKITSIPTVPIIFEGYDAIINKSGRGVMIIFKEYLEITSLDNINDLFSPALFIKISSSKSFVNLGLCYRSPNNSESEDTKLNKQIKTAAKTLKNLYLFGDFNHPEVDWDNMNCNKSENHPASLFLHTVEECKLDQIINKNTHLKPNCKPSMIDLIITNNKDLSSNPKFLPPIGKSHHVVILLKLLFEKEPICHAEKIKKFQTSKGNYTAINKELQAIDWDQEFCQVSNDVN